MKKIGLFSVFSLSLILSGCFLVKEDVNLDNDLINIETWSVDTWSMLDKNLPINQTGSVDDLTWGLEKDPEVNNEEEKEQIEPKEEFKQEMDQMIEDRKEEAQTEEELTQEDIQFMEQLIGKIKEN